MSDLIEDLKFTMLPGTTFKELFGFFTFYKILQENELEKNQLLVTGLNDISLTQKNGYVDGGIVFNIQDNLFKGLINHTNIYKYIREVEIPDDALVFIDYNSFKADKLILKERSNISDSEIWNDINYCKEVLLLDHRYISFIKNPPYELLDWLLSKRPIAIEYIDQVPNDLIIKVITNMPYLIKYVKNPTIEHYLLAYEKNSYAIQYIDIKPDILAELIKINPAIATLREKKNIYGNYIDSGHYKTGESYYPFINKGTGTSTSTSKQIVPYAPPTEAESAIEIKKNPLYIRHVTTQTNYLCQLAFSLNKEAIKYIEPKWMNATMCDEAVLENYKLLTYVPAEYISFMDHKIIISALEKNGKLIELIPNPTHEMCIAAVTNNPEAIYDIKNKSKDIIDFIIKKNPKYLHLVDDIDIDDEKELEKIINEFPTFYQKVKHKTLNLSIIAVNRIPGNLKYVPEEFQTEALCLSAINGSPKVLQYIINQTISMCLNAVSKDGTCLKFVKNKTQEICQKALENNPYALEFISPQTEDMCLSAISRDIMTIGFVLTMTEKILGTALRLSPYLIKDAINLCPEILNEEMICSVVSTNGLLLKYIPQHLMSTKACDIAINNNPDSLEYVYPEFMSLMLILKAVRKNGNVIRFVESKRQNRLVCLEAVKNQPNALRYISEEKQTHEICMAALNKDVLAFEYIKNKTPELCLYSVGKNPATMACIHTKDEVLYQMCICINPKALHYIRDIDMREQARELLYELEKIIST